MSLREKYKFLFVGLIMVGFLLVLAPAVLAGDTGVDKALGGLQTTGVNGFSSTDDNLYPTGGLPQIIGKVVGAVLALVGVIFFCLILWAGFGWMLAKGNEEEITKAKDVIFGAVLGLIVILGAYAITKLIAQIFNNALTGGS